MIDPADCTVIIPHLGQTSEQEYALDKCLESLKETCQSRVIVAKNGNLCVEHILDDHDVVIKEQGQELGVNAAAATVNTPWIFVSNDDMIFSKLWWEKLTQPIIPESATYCVSPKLIEPRSGAPTFEVYFCGGAGGDFDKEKWEKFVEEYYKRPEQTLRTGFNLPFLIRKDIWDLIGGYDINYRPFGSNSDSDLEYRIRLAGIQPYQ